jgi:DNA-3-methyladenine glycosylase I
MAMTYCEYVRLHPEDAFNKQYHDAEYGFPLHTDAELFERLGLEINQAGLSWLTILKKKDAFHRAFDGFDLDRVAGYGEPEIERLMADATIIRNRKKIEAVIENARRLQLIREQEGSFEAWLWKHHPQTKEQWVKLFKATFLFTGGEIVNEFLISTGFLAGAHEPGCEAYQQISWLDPAWMKE